MDIKDLAQNVSKMTSYEIEQKLDELVRTNYHFSNLNEQNKKLVLSLVQEYKKDVVAGVPVTDYKIQHDTYNLYENRLKLNLTQNDLDEIKQLLEAFKS